VSPSVTTSGILWHHERLTPPSDPDVRLVTSALDLGIVVADLPAALGISEEKTERLLTVVETTLGVRRQAFVVLAAARWNDGELLTSCPEITRKMTSTDRALARTIILGQSSQEIAQASGMPVQKARLLGAAFLQRMGVASRSDFTLKIARAARPSSEANSQIPPPGSTVRPVHAEGEALPPSSHMLGRLKRRSSDG